MLLAIMTGWADLENVLESSYLFMSDFFLVIYAFLLWICLHAFFLHLKIFSMHFATFSGFEGVTAKCWIWGLSKGYLNVFKWKHFECHHQVCFGWMRIMGDYSTTLDQAIVLKINVWTAVQLSSYMTLFNNSLHQANLSLYQIIRPTYTDECDQLENPEGVSCDGGDRYRRIDGRFCPNESFEVQYGCSTWDGIIVFKVQQLEKPILGRRQHRDEEIFERWVPRLTEYSHGLVEVLQNIHEEYLKKLIWIFTSKF